MADTQARPKHVNKLARPTVQTYVAGYLLSILLTFGAYFCVADHQAVGVFAASFLVPFILILAVTQFIVQLIFFLHLGTERRPRWKLLVFFFMLATVGIIVVGSLWIMSSLNYRMTPQQIQNYMNSQDGL